MQPAEAKVIAKRMHPGRGYKWHHSMFLGWPKSTKYNLGLYINSRDTLVWEKANEWGRVKIKFVQNQRLPSLRINSKMPHFHTCDPKACHLFIS